MRLHAAGVEDGGEVRAQIGQGRRHGFQIVQHGVHLRHVNALARQLRIDLRQGSNGCDNITRQIHRLRNVSPLGIQRGVLQIAKDLIQLVHDVGRDRTRQAADRRFEPGDNSRLALHRNL